MFGFHWAARAALLLLPIFIQPAQAQTRAALPDYVVAEFGTPPAIPSGAMPREVRQAMQVALVDSLLNTTWGDAHRAAFVTLVESKDPRAAWLISDLMRFTAHHQLSGILADGAATLLGIETPRNNAWGVITDHLIAWEIPAPPGYLDLKRQIFTSVEPGWERLFVKGDIDWRHVSWGGVLMDERVYDTTDQRCNCIPAADNPEVESAKDARWLKNKDIVFGIVVNGEARAYPRRIMEVREMVNDTLGGRDLGIPYCTLCGAAQAYFTDGLGVKRPVLRTSGLLIRSNKVMYDIESGSVFDTFLGKAVTGPLARKGITLKQAGVVTTTWGDWKKAHPNTTVLVEDLALGRDFDFRNGRDANGPIFPVGDVDPRLPVQEDVIGIVTASGKPVAFQRSKAVSALKRGRAVTYENVSLVLDGGGLRAVDSAGRDLGSHQAFWFAWSQFHPGTALWEG